MKYYQTKHGCKGISSSENTTEMAIFWLYNPDCDLDHDDSKADWSVFLAPGLFIDISNSTSTHLGW